MANPKPGQGNQGEGDKASDKKYRDRTEKFVNSKHGQDAIKQAGNLSPEEARKAREAEEEAKKRAKGEDPQIRHQSK